MNKRFVSIIAAFFLFGASGCFSGVDDSGTGGNAPTAGDHDGDGDPDDTDCDDNNNMVHHGCTEICNGIDDDCDGAVDENNVCNGNPVPTDSDGDGDPDISDCNDNNPSVHHGAVEVCNGIDDNCNGVTDENNVCGSTGSGTGSGTGSTGSGQSLGQRKLYAHYDADFDIDEAVWTKIWVYNAPNPDENGYQECLMNLWGVEGPNEVFVCFFFVPKGATVEVSAETIKAPQNTSSFIFDMCDYPGGAGNCQGLGNFCEDNSGGIKGQDGHDHIHGRDFWWSMDTVDGPGVNYTWKDNADPLGMCDANQLIQPVL